MDKIEKVDHDERFSVHEEETQSQSKIKESIDLLIVTSSIAKKIRGDELYRYKSVKVMELLNGKDLNDAEEYIEHSSYNPKVILFFIGGNDLCSNLSVEECVKKLRDLFESTHRCFPGSQVAINEILQRVKPEKLNHKMELFNKKIQGLCQGKKHLHFVPQSDLRTYSALYDGVHIKNLHLRKLVLNIKDVINPLLGMAPNQSRKYNSDRVK